MTQEECEILNELIERKANIEITRHDNKSISNIYQIEKPNVKGYLGIISYKEKEARITVYTPTAETMIKFKKSQDTTIRYDDPEYEEKLNTIIHGEQIP